VPAFRNSRLPAPIHDRRPTLSEMSERTRAGTGLSIQEHRGKSWLIPSDLAGSPLKLASHLVDIPRGPQEDRGSEMSETTSAPVEAPVHEQRPSDQLPRQGLRVGVGMLVGVGVLALVLGLVGGVVSHALFPAPAGAVGAVGRQGPVGETGPAGPVGPATNVDTSKLGFCVNVTYANNGGASWVSGVTIETPTVQSGTQSCPTGSFVPVTASPTPGA
jgi:hypothetical protein